MKNYNKLLIDHQTLIIDIGLLDLFLFSKKKLRNQFNCSKYHFKNLRNI